METRSDLERRLEKLQSDYRARRSILEMMQKSTTSADLARVRREQLDPIELEMQRVKEELNKFLRMGPSRRYCYMRAYRWRYYELRGRNRALEPGRKR